MMLLEHDLLGNFEFMKKELEKLKGFITVECFNLLDRHDKKYLDASRLWEFMFDLAGDDRRFQPTKRRLNGLLRRVSVTHDQKISFYDFANILKPTQLKAYIERVSACENTKAAYVDILSEQKNKLFKII